MNNYGDEILKLSNQICFPLYATGKEIVRRYQPYLEKYDLTYTPIYRFNGSLGKGPCEC